MTDTDVVVRLDPADAMAVEAAVDALADLLLDAVADGVSADFLADLSRDQARAWWAAAVADPDRTTWLAREGGPDGAVVGVVQLREATEPTGRHRADVTKLLVHSRARRRCLGTALMSALEAEALRRGRWLLQLDTQTGTPAEAFYRRHGWREIGVLADHAAAPDGVLTATTFFAKDLRTADTSPVRSSSAAPTMRP